MLQGQWNMWVSCNGRYCFVWRRQQFYHSSSQTWKSCSCGFCAGIPFPLLWVYPGDAKQGSYLSLFLKRQSLSTNTLQLKGLDCWLCRAFHLIFLAISIANAISFLPWTSTFYSTHVLILHINSLPPLLKQMSHHLVPGLSEHVQSVSATRRGCGELSWAPAALRLPSRGTGYNPAPDPGWGVGRDTHGESHTPRPPSWYPHPSQAL